jgi:hypothetical protein
MAKDKMTIEVEATIEPLVELSDAQKIEARKERALGYEKEKQDLVSKLEKLEAEQKATEASIRANGG